jgi:hypothetical protein
MYADALFDGLERRRYMTFRWTVWESDVRRR